MGMFDKVGAILGNAPTLAAAAAPGIGAFLGQESANAANAQQVLTQMDFQRSMSNTAHQREAEDLEKAGLNRILSAGGAGASTPAGAAATMQNSLAGMGALGSSAMEYKRLKQDVEQSENQIELIKEQKRTQETQQQLNNANTAKAETDKIIADLEKQDMQNTIDARTNATASLAEGGKVKQIPLASPYYRNKAYAESDQFSAASSAAKAAKLRSDFDQKAANYDNFASRVDQAIGTVRNAATAINPLGGLLDRLDRRRDTKRVNMKTGEIINP